MLARDRAAVRHDEVGGLVDEGAEGADARIAFEVEVPAGMDAAVAIVAVERALVAVLAPQLADLAQIAAESFGRNSCVLPALVSVRLAGDEGGGAETGLAHFPDMS